LDRTKGEVVGSRRVVKVERERRAHRVWERMRVGSTVRRFVGNLSCSSRRRRGEGRSAKSVSDGDTRGVKRNSTHGREGNKRFADEEA